MRRRRYVRSSDDRWGDAYMGDVRSRNVDDPEDKEFYIPLFRNGHANKNYDIPNAGKASLYDPTIDEVEYQYYRSGRNAFDPFDMWQREREFSRPDVNSSTRIHASNTVRTLKVCPACYQDSRSRGEVHKFGMPYYLPEDELQECDFCGEYTDEIVPVRYRRDL